MVSAQRFGDAGHDEAGTFARRQRIHQAAMTKTRFHRELPLTAAILLIGIAGYAYMSYDTVVHARTWVDEVTYTVKSWWYITGAVSPYTDRDPTWYMPLYFYQLGLWQALAGQGIEWSRGLSAAAGLINGVLVFDIVRRITGNIVAAALGVAIFLSVPSIAFYFSSATPIATVSLILLLCIWLMVCALGLPSTLTSVLIGVLCGALYFYRQNMILAIALIIPVYLMTLPRARWVHAAWLSAGMALVASVLLLVFPDKLLSYAIRLPIITPFLANLNLFQDPLFLVETTSTGPLTLDIGWGNFAWQDPVDALLLPYAGLLVCAGSIFVMARGSLKVLWAAPLAFVFLAVTHYVGSVGYCPTCVLPYTASFAGLGAICAGVALALAWRAAKRQSLPANTLILLFAAVVAGLNLTASGLATREEYKFYPSAMLINTRPMTWQEETKKLAAFLRENTNPSTPLLIVHNLITVPYAAFMADRTFPVQSLNMAHSYRRVKDTVQPGDRAMVLRNLEREGLWTDETLDRWLTKGFDTVVFQVDPRNRNSDLRARIETQFEKTATTGFRGWNIDIYRRISRNGPTGRSSDDAGR